MISEWRERAACKGKDVNYWFPSKYDGVVDSYARSVCFTCPVINECHEWALSQGEKLDGIYAGTDEHQRRKIIVFRRLMTA